MLRFLFPAASSGDCRRLGLLAANDLGNDQRCHYLRGPDNGSGTSHNITLSGYSPVPAGLQDRRRHIDLIFCVEQLHRPSDLFPPASSMRLRRISTAATPPTALPSAVSTLQAATGGISTAKAVSMTGGARSTPKRMPRRFPGNITGSGGALTKDGSATDWSSAARPTLLGAGLGIIDGTVQSGTRIPVCLDRATSHSPTTPTPPRWISTPTVRPWVCWLEQAPTALSPT